LKINKPFEHVTQERSDLDGIGFGRWLDLVGRIRFKGGVVRKRLTFLWLEGKAGFVKGVHVMGR
jgi:hypothetical protein